MLIAPKIDTNNCCSLTDEFSFLANYTHVEVQMLTERLVQESNCIIPLLEAYPNIQYVCLHAPFSAVDLGFVLMYPPYRMEFKHLLRHLRKMSADSGIQIDILYHLRTPVHEFSKLNGFKDLCEIDEILKGSSVRLLLENSVFGFNYKLSEADTIQYVFSNLKFNNVVACLDINHLQVSEKFWGQEYSLTSEYCKAIKNIHFAHVHTEHDTYPAMGHSMTHYNLEELKRDMKYIEGKGLSLDDLCIVAEIREPDYSTRELLKKELEMLKRYEEVT